MARFKRLDEFRPGERVRVFGGEAATVEQVFITRTVCTLTTDVRLVMGEPGDVREQVVDDDSEPGESAPLDNAFLTML